MKKYIYTLVLVAILVLGLALRSYNYSTWPREGATFDEYAWTWLGMSLWNTGIPTSWSPHHAYTNRRSYINPKGGAFTLVTPYLEHPPIFGLVAGGFAILTGERSFGDLDIRTIRLLALALGTLSIFAVYLLAREAHGRDIGLLSGFLYAIIPSVAVGSRLVQNENFFIPLFLLSLYFTHRYIEHGSKSSVYPAILIAGILPLAKIPWIAAPAAVCAMFLYSHKAREAWMTVGVTFIAILAYFAYGIYFDKTVFFNLWNLQLARYDMSFNSFFAIFQNPMITDRTFVDGWLYLGWATCILFMSKNLKKTYPVVFGFTAYLLIFLAGIPNEAGHGWYRYPFYPFLIIGLAAVAYEYFVKNRILTFAALATTGLSLLEYTWQPAFGFSYLMLRGYLALCAMTMMPLIWKNKKIENFATKLSYILAIFVLLLSCWAALYYNEQ